MLYKAKKAYNDLRKDIGIAISLDPGADANDPEVKQLKGLTSGTTLYNS